MKKTVSAILVALLSCALILGWRGWQNRAPALEDIRTLDPTQYPLTYELQTFKLRPHDRQWTLKTFTGYDENGEVEREEIYQLDEDGQSYYIAPNGDRIDVVRMPRLGFQNITGFLSEWDINQEDFDDAGRIIYRDAASGDLRELVQWYYRPDEPERSDDSAVCTLVRTMRVETPRDQEPWIFYGPEEEPRWESTCYEITTYDRSGNETIVSTMERDCYIKTDADGYLQMIVMDGVFFAKAVIRVDAYGRPLWRANYDRDGNLAGWFVWEYEDLH